MSLVLELLQPIEGVFVLDVSQLNGGDHLADTDENGLEWVDVTGDATSVNVRRGGSRDGITTTIEPGILNASFVDALDPAVDPVAYRPGLACRLKTSSGAVLYTGRTTSFVARDEKRTKTRFVTMAAVDAVATLANTPRHGVAARTNEGEPWRDRINRLMSSTPVPFTPLVDPPYHYDRYASDMPISEGHAYTLFSAFATWSNDPYLGSWRVDIDENAWGGPGSGYVFVYDGHNATPLVATISGLVPGEWYEFAWVDIGATGGLVTVTVEDVSLTYVSGGGIVRPGFGVGRSLRFRASGTSADVAFTSTLKISTHTYAFSLLQIESRRAWAANHLTETNLAKHLDIATASAGAGWYVDATGEVKITSAPGAPVLYLSDLDNGNDDTHASYTDIVTSHDTAAVVNTVSFANHGRELDENDDYVAVDATLGPWRATGSMGTYGPHEVQLETAIYAPATGGPAGVDRRFPEFLAGRLLDRYATPRLTITSVTLDVTDRPALVADLDIYSTVEVTYRGATYALAIIAIAHNVTPRKHFVTLELMEA